MRTLVIAASAALLAALSASVAVAQAPASDAMTTLAEDLSDCPPAADAGFNRDGSPRDVACTRQWQPGTVLRKDLSMSFTLGSAELTASAKAALDRFAAALARIPKWRPFAVEGHTDRSGSRELNQALSAARARSVVDYLASKGVDRRQMKARGYGYDRPLQGRSAEDSANRRVELFAS